MLNLIYFKSFLVYIVCITGGLFFTSSCAEKRIVDSQEIAKQQNVAAQQSNNSRIMVVENDNNNGIDDDTKFLIEAAEMQIEDINLGKLAQQKGNTSHVKELGMMMEKDHTKTLNELKLLAQSKFVTIPTESTKDSQETYRELNEKTANDFGKAYSKMMVEHHEDAIELFEETSTSSDDPEIRVWTSNKLAGLRTHLQHAEASKKECDKM